MNKDAYAQLAGRLSRIEAKFEGVSVKLAAMRKALERIDNLEETVNDHSVALGQIKIIAAGLTVAAASLDQILKMFNR